LPGRRHAARGCGRGRALIRRLLASDHHALSGARSLTRRVGIFSSGHSPDHTAYICGRVSVRTGFVPAITALSPRSPSAHLPFVFVRPATVACHGIVMALSLVAAPTLTQTVLISRMKHSRRDR
jgi:hypothetical protein